MKTIVLLVALGWMLTFLHASRVGEKEYRAKSTSIGEKSRWYSRHTGGDMINTRVNGSQSLSGRLTVSG